MLRAALVLTWKLDTNNINGVRRGSLLGPRLFKKSPAKGATEGLFAQSAMLLPAAEQPRKVSNSKRSS